MCGIWYRRNDFFTMSSGPTIVDIPTDGVGSTGFVKSRYAQHDFLYGRAIKTTLANALTANDETTVPSTQAITSLEAQKVDRAGDTMTGNLTLTNADLSARNVSASGSVTAPGLNSTGNLSVTDTTTTGTLDVLQDSDLRGNVTVHNNLTVLGTTTTVQSNIVTIDDPVIQVGTDTSSDTTLDRGVTFLYHDGSDAQTGFFGWDRNLNAFVMRPEATESPQNLIGGALGDIHANEFKGTTLELTQTAIVAGATTLQNTLNVQGISTFDEDVNIVNADLDANAVVSLSTSGKATTVRGTLNVVEDATFQTNVTVSGATMIDDSFETTGETKLASSGISTTVRGPLTVNQASTLTGAVTVAGATQINNALTATGETNLAAPNVATKVKGSLTVDQASTLTGAVTVVGATTLQSTLGVTGDVTVSTSALNFGSTHREQIHLYGTTYGIGTQTDGVYTRSPTGFRWYRGGEHASTGAGGSGVEAMVLDASGNLTVEKNITSLSDMRIKTDVHTLKGVSEKLLSVRGVRYVRKDQPNAGHEIGVIAQEIETVFPEVVLTDPKTGLKSVAYANLVGALIQAHNETRTELEALRRELAELRAQQT